MYVSITRFTVDPDVGMNDARIDEVISVTSRHPGWLGAYVFRSTEDPAQMVRFTYWESLEARDALYESEPARAIGLTEVPAGREMLTLVRADRPDGELAAATVPDAVDRE